MSGFAGFDISGYPGDDMMAWLNANTNLVWCGFYLGPAPSHGDVGWMATRSTLQQGGWGLAPIYVGQQLSGAHSSHVVTEAQGGIDGGDAGGLMANAGFPAGSCVYLDLEDGPPLNSPRSDYVAAWIDAVAAGSFRPGVYCSHAIAAAVQALRADVRIWAFNVPTTQQTDFAGTQFPDADPSGSGFADAVAWQCRQECRLNLPGAPVTQPVVDLSSATTPDPGAPSVGAAV
ncbi:MAG TPA: glycoside hydrolase domain-containing protein [Rhodopila sp.]|jgi:hypothetical protein